MAENGILDYQGMNQAIYRGATSNIVVDTQSMSIEIGAGNSSHTSNLHIECDHDANVASIQLNSNVVTEFSRSKKLIKYPRVAMTGPSAPTGYVVDVSDQQSGNSAWEAFDGKANINADHRWRTNDSRYTDNSSSGTPSSPTTAASTYLFTGSEAGDWISIEFPEKMKIVYYTITGIHRHTPYEGVIYGYDTVTTTWERVSSFINPIIHPGDNRPLESPQFQVDEGNTNYYSKYAMIVVKTNGHHAPSMYEWKLYGLQEYDSEAHGTDVTVKSYPNVPNTDWLEVYYDAKNYTSGVVQDETTNDRDGVLYGDTSLTSADGIHKFDFDGNGDYIKTTLTGFTGTTVTFSAWVFMDSVAAGRANTIMGLGNWGSTGSAAWIAVGTGGVLETGSISVGSCVSSVQASTLTKQWLHITGIVSSGDFRLYQDGQLIKSTNTTGAINYGTNPVLYLATRANSSGSPESTRYFDCKIANARLFNRALTSDEIYQLYAYQKEDFGHSTNNMTLKAGRLGIGTSEPRAALDVRGDVRFSNVPHIYATDDGGYDGANEAYINFDRVESSYGIALVGTNGTFEITEQAGAGVYYVDGSVSFHQSNGTEVRNLELHIHLNGVNHHSNNRNYGLTAMKHVSSSTYSDLGVTALVKCNVGDKIRLYGVSRSSSINVHTPNNKMVIFKVQST